LKARAIMVLGTGSHVGKSLIVAALCRIFAQQGVSVAPFKSQNMSLNSAATIEGLEIGRAQALQAEAAGIAASVDMNPILLKPIGNMSSQVVVRGKIWGKLSASDYHRRRVEELMPIVLQSYEALAARHDVIILEGAGSPAEINLKQHDIVNMRMAEMSGAKCLLVGDIDRGGVFASLFGTVALLEDEEQTRIAGFVINKFRGDLELLQPGIRMMAERMAKPCLGVVPYLNDLWLEEEDSVGLATTDLSNVSPWQPAPTPDRALRVAVVALPSFSNFTDFDALRAEPSVTVQFCRDAKQLSGADLLILPGSKQTVDDLHWMRDQGIDKVLMRFADRSLIVGICGGLQMLGKTIRDPHCMESKDTTYGLDLLPIHTTMQKQKTTNLVRGRMLNGRLFGQEMQGIYLTGYEIHIGETTYLNSAKPFAELSRIKQNTSLDGPQLDGCIADSTRVFGTYLHGIFDEDGFRHAFIAAARSFHQLEPSSTLVSWKLKREQSFEKLASAVQQSLDMATIFSWVGFTFKDDLH
jgi:adenosylcobyric acid synthase